MDTSKFQSQTMIPYEESEVKNASNEDASSSAVKNSGPEILRNEAKSPSKPGERLALVPLHPACKKQKLEAKPFPLVLGRNNMANWYWKVCPCQHYCRLHCRPVSQNIRSLSKVMVQIDSESHCKIVAKNPHLITCIPERSPGESLQVGDIISIGRKDREPWMKFTVVSWEAPPAGNKKEPHRPAWYQANSMPSSSEMDAAGNGQGNSSSNNNDQSGGKQPADGEAAPEVAGSGDKGKPLEWITTSAPGNVDAQGPGRQEQLAAVSQLMAAAVAASNQGVSRAKQENEQQKSQAQALESQSPTSPLGPRKRRKHSHLHHHPTRSSKDRSDKARTDSNISSTATGKLRAGGNPASSTAFEKELNMLFRDYETSANLIRDAQRKRKRTSKSSATSTMRPRDFLSEKVPSSDAKSNAESPPAAVEESTPRKEQESNQNSSASDDSKALQAVQQQSKILPPTSNTAEEQTHGSRAPPLKKSAVAVLPMEETPMSPPMLSLPQLSSESFPVGSSVDVRRSDPNPLTDLSYWKTVIGQEEAAGRKDSLRCNLACMVIDKNVSHVAGERLWLPPMLESQYSRQAE